MKKIMARSNLSTDLRELAKTNDEHAYNLLDRAEDLDYATLAYVNDPENQDRINILLKAWSNANVAYAAACGKHPRQC